jgi:RHS repeat-associated protein
VSWLVFDLHGSVVGLCQATSGSLTDAYRFDGFGVQIDAYPGSGGATNPFRYRGLLNIGADAVLGALLDMGARDYSPQLGVFTQADSVQGSAANPLTMNRFLYALANPATLVDPDGHAPLAACDPDCTSSYDSGADAQLLSTNQQTRTTYYAPVDGCDADCAPRIEANAADPLAPLQAPTPGMPCNGVTNYQGICVGQDGPQMFGVCAGASVSFPTVAGVTKCVYGSLDDWLAGRVVRTTTWSPFTQGGVLPGASVTGGIAFTNATNAAQLSKWFAGGGGSVSIGGVGVNGDVYVGTAADRKRVWTTTWGVGLGAKWDFHGGATYTTVEEVVYPWYSPPRLIGQVLK